MRPKLFSNLWILLSTPKCQLCVLTRSAQRPSDVSPQEMKLVGRPYTLKRIYQQVLLSRIAMGILKPLNPRRWKKTCEIGKEYLRKMKGTFWCIWGRQVLLPHRLFNDFIKWRAKKSVSHEVRSNKPPLNCGYSNQHLSQIALHIWTEEMDTPDKTGQALSTVLHIKCDVKVIWSTQWIKWGSTQATGWSPLWFRPSLGNKKQWLANIKGMIPLSSRGIENVLPTSCL